VYPETGWSDFISARDSLQSEELIIPVLKTPLSSPL
jgi:hypothetical protein